MWLPWLAWTAAGAGTLTPEVTCRAASDVVYSLYLPDGWNAGRSWPLLVVLDPTEGAERFYGAADQLGVVVASPAGGLDADVGLDWAAIVADVGPRAHIDGDGLLLAGVEVGARAAWALAEVERTRVVGVIGVGAGTASGVAPRVAPSFAWYGLVAEQDVHHAEAVGTVRALQRVGAPAVLEEGLGADAVQRALGFLVVQAEAAGRLEVVPGRREAVEAGVQHWVSEGSAGWYAVRGWPGQDVDGWLEVPGRRRAVRRAERVWAREIAFQARVATMVDWVEDTSREPPKPEQAQRALGWRALSRRARRTGTVRGDAAGRMRAYARLRLGEGASRALELRGYSERAAVARAAVAVEREDADGS